MTDWDTMRRDFDAKLRVQLQSQNALRSAQAEQSKSAAYLNNQNAMMVQPIGQSEIRRNDAQTNLFGAQGRNYDANTAGLNQAIEFNKRTAGSAGPAAEVPVTDLFGTRSFYDPGTLVSGSLTAPLRTQNLQLNRDRQYAAPISGTVVNPYGRGISRRLYDMPLSDAAEETTFGKLFKLKGLGDFQPLTETSAYKRGTARVPGRGSGDVVPAMLEPGEAVLNKKAAGMIGRDKIAAANKKGNAMRQKQDASNMMNKLAAFLSKKGMA